MNKRIVCWFSCGAASAVATKIAIAENAKRKDPIPLEVVYTKVIEEHPDNERFLKDCEQWFGVPIKILTDERFGGSIVKCFDYYKLMSTISGAPCTLNLKKNVRKKFERHGDIQVFGYTSEEQHRVDRFIDANAEARIWPVLVEQALTHADCLAILERAGIELPVMYKLGYHHNNCIGCVKGGGGYWNKIRKDFPDVFKARCEQSRRVGTRLINFNGERVFLDEMPEDYGRYEEEPEIQCGIFCEMADSLLR